MDDETINKAVEFINERVAAHVYNGSIEIGNFVLEKFFNNNPPLLQKLNPQPRCGKIFFLSLMAMG